MALRIVNGKVVDVPPPRLTKEEIEKMENTPVNEELIKSAMSINFNIVTPKDCNDKSYKVS
jgi:hypothetical protein